MAGSEPSTTRRALLGAAAAIPVLTLAPFPARPEPVEGPTAVSPDGSKPRGLWDRRLARYRHLAAATEEAAATGWFAAANAGYDRARAEIAARFPGSASECDKARALRRAAFERVDGAEDGYWERCTAPTQQAAVTLALTPAPDLHALAAKIAIMRAQRLHELNTMTYNCFEVLEEDVRRLDEA
jgi:hypothetical protein